MNPSSPSESTELEQLVNELCQRDVSANRPALRERLLKLLAQEYSRGVDAALGALPEHWNYQKLEVCPLCGDRQYSCAPDAHWNPAIDQARQNIEKLKEPSND